MHMYTMVSRDGIHLANDECLRWEWPEKELHKYRPVTKQICCISVQWIYLPWRSILQCGSRAYLGEVSYNVEAV